jgi:tetratricopeptide (TPR) repeat protein
MSERRFGLATAEALLDVGRPAQAREHAAGYLAGHPEDARGLRLIARCYEATDEYPQMLAAAQAAVATDADSYQGHVLLASAYIHLRRYWEAVEAAAVAARLFPNGWRAHLLSGVAQCALGRRRGGMAAVSRAVSLAPDEPHVHYVQALLRHSAGNRLGAKHAYRRALRLEPEHAGAQRGLGHIALAAGRLVDAVGHFTGAAAAEPAAGGGGIEKALLGIAGWALLASWLLLLVLVFGMFPPAWVLAAGVTGGYTVAAVRFWRRVPASSRVLVRARLGTPRLYVRLGAAAVCALVALGLGVADAGIDPNATEVNLVPQLGALGVAFLGSAGAVLAVDVADRTRARDPAAEAPDAPLQHATARLTWRVLRAGCVPAAVLWCLVVTGVGWQVRAVTGTGLIVGYAAALVRIRGRVVSEPNRANPVLARLLGPLSLGTGVLLLFLPLASYWPGAVPDPAEDAVLVILGLVLLGYVCWLPVRGAPWLARWLWRRCLGRWREARRLRPAAGRPAP